MIRNLLLAVLCAIIFSCRCSGQEYSYTHYGTAEGLPDATVLCITQDKEGFIWTGTETGASRFDGTHFQNFTTRDGLPDLEILIIFGDSKGRVWMAPFRKTLCYYYKGKIYNEHNDPLLARIHLQGFVKGFAEDAAGNILVQETDALHQVNADGSLTDIDSLDGRHIRDCLAVSAGSSGNFLVATNGKILEFSGKRLLRCMPGPPLGYNTSYVPYVAMNPAGMVSKVWSGGYEIRMFAQGTVATRSFPLKHIGIVTAAIFDDSLVFTNELSGSFEYNLHTGKTKHYLPGKAVSRVFRDASGDLWFTTLGEGIFKLNSNAVAIINPGVPFGEMAGVSSVRRIGNELWVGNDRNYVFRYSLPDWKLISREAIPQLMQRRIHYIDTTANGVVLVGGDNGLFARTPDGRLLRLLPATVKAAWRISDRKLLIASHLASVIVDLSNLRVIDTLFRERATIAYGQKDTLYIGGLNGLYRWVKDGPPIFLGEKMSFLRKRMAAIAESPDGILWIASADDEGVIGFKDGRQVAALTQRQGLTSNVCRCLLIHSNVLWVGTDKGLNKVELGKPGYPVTQYTLRDGLASDLINTVFIDGSRVYVGTPAGLCYFDENQAAKPDSCRLFLLSLMNFDRDRIADTARLELPYTDKRVRFEFAGVSYRSAGDIVYRYRMLGIDDKWRQTRDNYLEYPDLPSGNYEWQLYAVNKFGKKSRVVKLPITVATQFWKKTWFIAGAWLFSIFILWLFLSQRARLIRRRQREKEELTQRMGDLEVTALKSQMNPHFIFNCLSSIQKFIFNGEIEASNKYIAGLARLIRMTLINSSKSLVSIGEEIDYLSSYLSLEKMRFKEMIGYSIEVDPAIDRSAVLIPPMLVQPHVENALIHGLGDATHGVGFLRVAIEKADGQLVVTVEDNGIGRPEAAQRRIIRIQGDSPKGMSLTGDRIAMLNKLYGGAASQTIIDLLDDQGCPVGTRVTLRLPLFCEQALYS
ncbi:sensor histidine kinase [Puia sp.]|uniref:sensor histidine kinase n=1 Tax=Puia sp. TaxID=2045100 RepID=UPI002F401300